MNLPDGWREWRTHVDRRLDHHDDHLSEIGKAVVVLETRQQIIRDNESARHAKTPQLAISLVSMGISILFFVLQLIVARAGTP